MCVCGQRAFCSLLKRAKGRQYTPRIYRWVTRISLRKFAWVTRERLYIFESSAHARIRGIVVEAVSARSRRSGGWNIDRFRLINCGRGNECGICSLLMFRWKFAAKFGCWFSLRVYIYTRSRTCTLLFAWIEVRINISLLTWGKKSFRYCCTRGLSILFRPLQVFFFLLIYIYKIYLCILANNSI